MDTLLAPRLTVFFENFIAENWSIITLHKIRQVDTESTPFGEPIRKESVVDELPTVRIRDEDNDTPGRWAAVPRLAYINVQIVNLDHSPCWRTLLGAPTKAIGARHGSGN
jgi:hypothetical protein